MSSIAGTAHVNTVYRKLLCSSDDDRCLTGNAVSKKVKFAHELHVHGHQAGDHPGFCSMKQLRVQYCNVKFI